MILVDEVRLFPGARPPFHRGSCHLTTTCTVAELHAFADQLGLARHWFQSGTRPHYDLTRGRRAKALALGAVFVPARLQAMWRRGLVPLESISGWARPGPAARGGAMQAEGCF